ncbi:MAG TPA: preprotein translocase subunit SecA, partial [Patescibacteria group bacterium]|nr:preprotein translocase subunit SecA [Patescibacteria group bacterium]
MFKNLFKFLDLNQREVDKLGKTVAKINAQESKYKNLKLSDFSKETEKFKKRIEKGESLESILPEAFALVREASWRILGQRHYDVQLMAAVALFEGKIVEQKTGEG